MSSTTTLDRATTSTGIALPLMALPQNRPETVDEVEQGPWRHLSVATPNGPQCSRRLLGSGAWGGQDPFADLAKLRFRSRAARPCPLRRCGSRCSARPTMGPAHRPGPHRAGRHVLHVPKPRVRPPADHRGVDHAAGPRNRHHRTGSRPDEISRHEQRQHRVGRTAFRDSQACRRGGDAWRIRSSVLGVVARTEPCEPAAYKANVRTTFCVTPVGECPVIATN
jgi:hypothetical protein